MESIMKETVMFYIDRLPDEPYTQESQARLERIIKEELKNSKQLNKKATWIGVFTWVDTKH